MIFTVLNVFVRIAQVAIIAGLGWFIINSQPVSAKDMMEKWKELNDD